MNKTKTKTASEILKERLVTLNPNNKSKKTFNISDFEAEAKKVKETFGELNENIQHPQSL